MYIALEKTRFKRKVRIYGGSWSLMATFILLLLVAGCGSGDLTAPDDIIASWDRLEFRALNFQDKLEINNTGDIVLTGGDEGAEAGILGPQTWHSLEAALANAELTPLSAISAGDPNEGAVVFEKSGVLQGLVWNESSVLTHNQSNLITLLQEIRLAALTPASERIDLHFGQRLLHGYDAIINHSATYLIRDVDALLSVLKNDLGRETVLLPEIDFEREILLAVFLGPRTNQAYDIEIHNEISLMISGCYQISVTQYTRDESCPHQFGHRGVFELYKLPRSDQDLFLDWRTIETECTTAR